MTDTKQIVTDACLIFIHWICVLIEASSFLFSLKWYPCTCVPWPNNSCLACIMCTCWQVCKWQGARLYITQLLRWVFSRYLFLQVSMRVMLGNTQFVIGGVWRVFLGFAKMSTIALIFLSLWCAHMDFCVFAGRTTVDFHNPFFWIWMDSPVYSWGGGLAGWS